MSRSSQKVLVTGAGGFIGKNLVLDQVAKGRGVIATDIDLSGLEAMKLGRDVALVPLDIRSSGDLRPHVAGCDVIFHLAAAHLDVLRDETWFSDVNVVAAGNLARLAAEEGVRRFVHCSTVGVYGPLKSLPADERTPTTPDIPYERTKLAGEQAVQQAASSGGMSVVIMRPAWVYGPGCPRTLKLIRTIARKRFFFVGKGENLRHPVYISDMLNGFELAATQQLPGGEIVLVAGPDTVSVQQLVDLIIAELGMNYAPPRLPTWFMEAACLAVEKLAGVTGKEPPFSRRSLKFFSESSAFDISKARRLLDYYPQVDIKTGLHLTVQYYRDQGIL